MLARRRRHGDHARVHRPPGARDRQRVHARASARSVGVPARPPPDGAAARGRARRRRRRADQPLGGRRFAHGARACPRPRSSRRYARSTARRGPARKPASTSSGIASLSTTGSPSNRSTASRLAPPGANVRDERVERRTEPRLVGIAQRHERAPAALDVEHRLAAERDDVGAGDARGARAGALRPRQRARRTAAPGRRRRARARRASSGRSRSSRSRSTAPPSANCAPPRPSTK